MAAPDKPASRRGRVGAKLEAPTSPPHKRPSPAAPPDPRPASAETKQARLEVRNGSMRFPNWPQERLTTATAS